MVTINSYDLSKTVIDSLENAKKNYSDVEYLINPKRQRIISNNIPYYDINVLQHGAYISDYFVSFFADMRQSTKRMVEIGVFNTFLTMHAVIPTMIYIIEKCNGGIVDIPGDGIMALFKVSEENGDPKELFDNSESIAVYAANELLVAFRDIVNPLLAENKIPPVSFGIGIDTGQVIVTKIGTSQIADIKAIGISIYNAAKHSKGSNEIFISREVYEKTTGTVKKQFKKSCEEGWFRSKVS